jgi:hypothetical protein
MELSIIQSNLLKALITLIFLTLNDYNYNKTNVILLLLILLIKIIPPLL